MRRDVIEEVMYFLIVQVAMSMLVSLMLGLFLTIGVDAANSWWPQVPTISYGDAYWLSVFFLMALSMRPSSWRDIGKRRDF